MSRRGAAGLVERWQCSRRSRSRWGRGTPAGGRCNCHCQPRSGCHYPLGLEGIDLGVPTQGDWGSESGEAGIGPAAGGGRRGGTI